MLIIVAQVVATVMFEGRLVSPLLSGDPYKRFSFVEPAILYWGHQLRFRLPPYFAFDLWSLRAPALNLFTAVTHVSEVVSLIACPIMAITGYVVFDRTQGNILDNFSSVGHPPCISYLPLIRVFQGTIPWPTSHDFVSD